MTKVFPVAMGAVMGLMMPFMVQGLGAQALVWFVLGHVVVIAGALVLAALALRYFNRAPAWLRMHRPSVNHAAQMLMGAVIGFGGLHLWAHGLGGA